MDEWLESLEHNNKSKHTIRAYRTQVQLFIHWFELTLGELVVPERITSIDLRDYRVYLQNVKKRKARTVNVALNALSSWLQFYGNNVKMPTGIKVIKGGPKSLDRNQQNALRRAVERNGILKDQAVIIVLLNAGLRVSEAADLDVEDLIMGPRSGTARIRSGKGNKERIVPLNAEVRAVLREYLGGRTVGPVFLSQRKSGTGRLSASGIMQIVAKYGYLSKLYQDISLHPHILRHTFARNLLDEGVDLVTVAELLGHESLETTKIYTKPSEETKAAAVEKIAWED